MIQIDLTPEIRNRARREAMNMGPIGGSITGGAANIIGFIGEIVVADITGAEPRNTKDYDLILPDGRRVDVKSKTCKSTPQPSYDCSVAAHGTQQDCDEYVFVRVFADLSRAWILGSIPKQEFYAKAKHWKKGEVDEDNGYKVRADCYNLPIKELYEVCQSQTL